MSLLANLTFEKELADTKVLDFTIIQLAESLASFAQERGFPVKPYTQKSLITLSGFPAARKEKILANLNTTLNIVRAGIDVEREMPSPDYSERRLVEKALDFYGFELREPDFWKTLKSDELVEIYNAENIQVFRTFNFFKTSSYSIMDLIINEWFNLWERPKWTLDSMYKVVSAIFSGELKGIVPANIPEHLIKEIFNAEDEAHFISRSSLCKFGIVCPVYGRNNNEISGLLVSARVIPVSLGEETKTISFI